MKKSKNTPKPRSRKAKQAVPQTPATPVKPDRRKLLRNIALGVVGLGLIGFVAVPSVQATLAERDLTRIGQGVPSIVQVHDPQCPVCQTLQREARAALKAMDGPTPLFLVADIKTDVGAAFAAAHRVPHVTLVLFDADGGVQEVLQGANARDALQPVFETLAQGMPDA